MSDWKMPYEQLVNELSGAIPSLGMRENPRFPVNSHTDFQVKLGGEAAHVRDVSVGGMALYSEYAVPKGREIALTVNNALKIHSEVIYCAPTGEWSPGNPPLHGMGLRFLCENDGYRVAMLALGGQGGLVDKLMI